MLQLLILEDDALAAELAIDALHSAGLPCAYQRVTTEVEFRASLARSPNIVLSDSNVPGFDGMAALAVVMSARPATPFIFLSSHMGEIAIGRALESGATDCIAKSDLTRLPSVVRRALDCGKGAGRRASDRCNPRAAAQDAAGYLHRRQIALERALEAQDASKLSSLLSRTPPAPVALMMVESATTRARYVKLLRITDVEVEVAQDANDALRRLAERTHAVLFTDRLDLIREVRQLNAGSAVHIVFLQAGGDAVCTDGLRAGANDVMSEAGDGEQFWARLTNARRIVSFAASLQSAITDNRLLSTIDELTRVGNRRYFEQQWPREVARATRFRRPLSLVMCDIDHFKSINDRYGHLVGDDVLREFGNRLTHGLRLGEDWVARIGGEEFAIVLPETGRCRAQAIAERLRESISAVEFRASGFALSVTASLGFCGLEGSCPSTSDLSERMVMMADGALYESKRCGRNRVTGAS